MTHATPLSFLESAWLQAWSDLGLTPPEGLLASLLQAHEEPQRRYHTGQHLTECLQHFESARGLAVHPGEVAIALWFHDAIYDVRGQHNERRSADWAAQALRTAGASGDTVRRVEGLIMATCHDAAPVEADACLLVDIDLAILGASPTRFAEYDKQIREEYGWVPGVIYRMKRRSVLAAFLARDHVYNTPHFRQRLESQARVNLRGACQA